MKLERRYLLLALALAVPLTFAGAHSSQRAAVEAEVDESGKAKIIEDFTRALVLAADNYAGDVDFAGATKSAILGMLHTLDPHSSFLDRKEWETFQNEQRSRYSGIGSTIAQRDGKVYIVSPFEGTPAHRAGIRFGDHIMEINGESTEGLTSIQVSGKLLGPEGTIVKVKVRRAGASEPIEYKLVRATVPLPSISSSFMLNKNTGYIYLSRGFNLTTSDEMRNAIRELREQGMSSLVLDLRGNRGGLVDQAWRVANIFLMNGQKVISMRGRPSAFQPRDLVAFNRQPDDYPLVVLINRGTASAAEIVAGALQDHDRAQIVGESSFGKGLVQTVFQLTDGSGVTLTTGKYYTPSGRLIQRDYNNRSFYDYITQRNRKEPAARTDERHTDSGRLVYGGGGIAPDVEVKISGRDQELSRVWIEPVFLFVRELVAGQIASLAEFRVDSPADHTRLLTASDVTIGDKVLAAFKNWLGSNKQFASLAPRVDKDAAYLKRQMRYDAVTAAFGQETALQVLLEGDSQLQRALEEMPKARSMAEDVRRAWATARPSGGLRRE